LRRRTPLCCRASFNISLGFIFLSQGNNTILLIVLGYPSRPNLNCLIVVLRCIGRGCWIPDPLWIVDIRWAGKTTINILKNGKTLRFTHPWVTPSILPIPRL
jgi:hypothetical protein